MNASTLAILGYVALQLGIGMWASRGIRTERDYLVAGRRLGPALAFFSVFATWFGAETCIGSSGEAFSSGLSAVRADPFGYAGCLLLFGLVLAVPLYKRGLTTLGDLFRERFGPRAEKLAVLVMVPSSVMWAGAQVRAFGQVLSAASAQDVTVMTTVAAAVVIAYTAVGGMMADAVSDLVQGSVLAVGLLALLVMAHVSGDLAQLGSTPATHLSLLAPEESLLDVLEAWTVPLLGSLVAQELVSRAVSARSAHVARSAALLAAPAYLLLGLVPVTMGLLATVLTPELAHPEQVLPHAAARYFSPLMAIVFQGALVSAILSTVDSALLVAGSLVAHNVIVPLKPSLSERGKLRVNRYAVLLFGGVAYALALSADSVYGLVEAASAFGSAGVFVCTLLGLFTRFGGEKSALAALSLGTLVYAFGEHALQLPHPFLTALASAALGYAALGLVEARALHASMGPAAALADAALTPEMIAADQLPQPAAEHGTSSPHGE